MIEFDAFGWLDCRTIVMVKPYLSVWQFGSARQSFILGESFKTKLLICYYIEYVLLFLSITLLNLLES